MMATDKSHGELRKSMDKVTLGTTKLAGDGQPDVPTESSLDAAESPVSAAVALSGDEHKGSGLADVSPPEAGSGGAEPEPAAPATATTATTVEEQTGAAAEEVQLHGEHTSGAQQGANDNSAVRPEDEAYAATKAMLMRLISAGAPYARKLAIAASAGRGLVPYKPIPTAIQVFPSLPVDNFWQEFDCVRLTVCSAETRSMYEDNEAVDLGAMHFSAAEEITEASRTALLLFDVDHKELLGVWKATRSKTPGVIRWRVVRRLPPMGEEGFRASAAGSILPELPPNDTSARARGDDARLLLRVMAEHAATVAAARGPVQVKAAEGDEAPPSAQLTSPALVESATAQPATAAATSGSATEPAQAAAAVVTEPAQPAAAVAMEPTQPAAVVAAPPAPAPVAPAAHQGRAPPAAIAIIPTVESSTLSPGHASSTSNAAAPAPQSISNQHLNPSPAAARPQADPAATIPVAGPAIVFGSFHESILLAAASVSGGAMAPGAPSASGASASASPLVQPRVVAPIVTPRIVPPPPSGGAPPPPPPVYLPPILMLQRQRRAAEAAASASSAGAAAAVAVGLRGPQGASVLQPGSAMPGAPAAGTAPPAPGLTAAVQVQVVQPAPLVPAQVLQSVPLAPSSRPVPLVPRPGPGPAVPPAPAPSSQPATLPTAPQALPVPGAVPVAAAPASAPGAPAALVPPAPAPAPRGPALVVQPQPGPAPIRPSFLAAIRAGGAPPGPPAGAPAPPRPVVPQTAPRPVQQSGAALPQPVSRPQQPMPYRQVVGQGVPPGLTTAQVVASRPVAPQAAAPGPTYAPASTQPPAWPALPLVQAAPPPLVPLPPAAPSPAEQPAEAPAARPASALSCPLCIERSGCWFLLSCKHMGPCEECCPTAEQVHALYPACVRCNTPVVAKMVIKARVS